MSEKEIDEILEEIKRHAQQEKEAEEAPAVEAVEDEPRSDAFREIMKIVNEEDDAENEEAENSANSESSADEKLEAIEAQIAAEADSKAEEEPEQEAEATNEEAVDFSLSGADEKPAEAAEEEVVFTIPEEAEKENTAKEDEEAQLVITEEAESKAPADTEAEAQEAAEEAEAETEDDFEINDYMKLPPLSPEENAEEEDYSKGSSGKKKAIIISIAVILIIVLGVGIYFGFFHNKGDNTATTATKQAADESTTAAAATVLGPTNPLTGEAGYNQTAIGKRPVAVVVENEYSTEAVRPQWGLSEADIVLEGESEYSTRLLLFWADYTNMPSQIGSTRSARPPFIRFSQLFDSVFIHAGLSKSKGNYVGANTVFETENVDHINLLSYSEDGMFFGRDKSRTSTIEHTGYLNGTNTASLLQKANVRTELNTARFSKLEFNETPQKLSDTAATSAKFVWSDVNSNGHCPKVGKFYYDSSLELYSTTDFDSSYGNANLGFKNLIFLLDTTEYVVKSNYKGSGNSETYCNYALSGGKGTILSQGTAIEITWGVSNGKFWMKDASGKSVKLNPGKSYIGYGSSNHGGYVTLNYETAG